MISIQVGVLLIPKHAHRTPLTPLVELKKK